MNVSNSDISDLNWSPSEVSKFNDGEINIRLTESVRGKHVFIIQSTCPSTQSINDNLIELFLLIRTCKRASVASITVVGGIITAIS